MKTTIEPTLADKLPPKVFTIRPWNSITNKSEAEIVARNIMVIRERLGKWNITWTEYEQSRIEDGGFPRNEQSYFNEVMPLIKDPIGAIAFSRSWAEAARKYLV